MAGECRRDARLRTGRPEFVARKLLHNEAVVRLVSIKGLNYIIAISPCIWPGFIRLESLALGVACKVEPVPAPALAVSRRGEQAVHHSFESLRRTVGDESLHFFRSGRQARQVEGGAAEQRDLIRRTTRLDAFGLQFRQNELIDRVADPRLLLHYGRGLVGNLLKGPEFALALGERIGGQQQGATGEQSYSDSTHRVPQGVDNRMRRLS